MARNICTSDPRAVLFKLKSTFGDAIVLRKSRSIVKKTFPEGYFMKPGLLSKDYKEPVNTNPITNFFRSMYKTLKDIKDAMKPETADNTSV